MANEFISRAVSDLWLSARERRKEQPGYFQELEMRQRYSRARSEMLFWKLPGPK
jgi:hypothetical protein